MRGTFELAAPFLASQHSVDRWTQEPDHAAVEEDIDIVVPGERRADQALFRFEWQNQPGARRRAGPHALGQQLASRVALPAWLGHELSAVLARVAQSGPSRGHVPRP